jgi:cytochrome c oxidase subunit IV
MATTAPASAPTRDEDFPALGEGEHGHMGDKGFIGVALFLALLTAIEVGLYYLEKEEVINQRLNVALLLGFAGVKFYIVAAWFMHLKFDHPQFKRFFIGGAVLAFFCYNAVLSAFGTLKGYTHWAVFAGLVLVLLIIGVTRNKVFEANEHGDGHDHTDHDHDDHSHAPEPAHAH